MVFFHSVVFPGCLGSCQVEPVLPVFVYVAFREIYVDLTLEHQSLYCLQPACSSVMDANTPEARAPDHLRSQLLVTV